MAITTLSGVISGLQAPVSLVKAVPGSIPSTAFVYSMWARTPGAGSYDTTLNGATLSSTSAQVAGQIRYIDPPSGNGYLAKVSLAIGGNPGTIIIADRLWHNGGIVNTTLTAQSITSPTWPARDLNGATTGEGVRLAVEVSAGIAVNPSSFSISYTNTAGTAGRTATNTSAVLNSQVGTTYEMNLQAGDTGVKSVESITLGASSGGTYNIVAYRELTRLPALIANKTYIFDAIKLGFPRVYNGSVPYMMLLPAATSGYGVVTGSATFSQG